MKDFQGMDTIPQLLRQAKRITRSKYGPILILISISLILGLLIADDFGLSWDLYKEATYGESVLNAYTGDRNFLGEGGNRPYYGPFYWMLLGLVSRLIRLLQNDWMIVDGWLFANFLTFQLAVFSIYLLSLRIMKKAPAFLVCVLFATQPFLFGHAFINQKDIPFMAFFSASVALGLIGVDKFHRKVKVRFPNVFDEQKSLREVLDAIKDKWVSASKRRRTFLVVLVFVAVLVTLDLLVFNDVLVPWAQSIVRDAYYGSSWEPINWLFNQIATDAYKTPVEMYYEKASWAYSRGRIITLFMLLVVIISVWRMIFRSDQRKLPVREWLGGNAFLLLAAIVLGLTTSIKVAGPFAGILVSSYFVIKTRFRWFAPIILYWLVAMIITYATWPFLWGSPLIRFLESLEFTGSFTHQRLLFQGIIYTASKQPAYYVPLLVALKLTEPLVVLSIVGLLVGVIKASKRTIEQVDFFLILLWGSVPIFWAIVSHMPIYDNFRHLLFALPPFIILAGVGLASLLERVRPRIVTVLLLIFLLLPGLIGIVALHPYEYIYFNSFGGGIDRAYGYYELEYWCTSLRETMDFINETAPLNSTVVVDGPTSTTIPFARKDLKIVGGGQIDELPDFAVGCRWAVWDDDFYPDFDVVFEVRRGQGVLSIVKSPR